MSRAEKLAAKILGGRSDQNFAFDIETARKLGRPIPEPRGKLAYA